MRVSEQRSNVTRISASEKDAVIIKKLKNHIGAIWLLVHEYNCKIQNTLSKRANPDFFSSLD